MQSIKAAFVSADMSSWENHRIVVKLVVGLLERIRAAEEIYALNRQSSDAYSFAEYSIRQLDAALDVISSVYNETRFILIRGLDIP